MASLRHVSIVLLACAMFVFVAAKKEMTAGASEVDIADDGEMTFKHKKGNASDDAFPLKIRLDELSQMDFNGKELTNCSESDNTTQPGMGWMKHGGPKKAQMKGMMRKFRKFQNQKFSFEKMKINHPMRHGSMRAKLLRFNTALSEDLGTVTLELVAPDTAGDISIGEEKQKLKKGDMKFNMELSKWNWCENAAFLDVYMKVVGKQKPKKRTSRSKVRPSTYYVGDNVTVSFSGKFQNKSGSGSWYDMPDGFPKVDSVDTSRIIVRFPRFDDETLVYDPTVSGVEDGVDDVSAGSRLSVSAIFIVLTTTAVYAML